MNRRVPDHALQRQNEEKLIKAALGANKFRGEDAAQEAAIAAWKALSGGRIDQEKFAAYAGKAAQFEELDERRRRTRSRHGLRAVREALATFDLEVPSPLFVGNEDDASAVIADIDAGSAEGAGLSEPAQREIAAAVRSSLLTCDEARGALAEARTPEPKRKQWRQRVLEMNDNERAHVLKVLRRLVVEGTRAEAWAGWGMNWGDWKLRGARERAWKLEWPGIWWQILRQEEQATDFGKGVSAARAKLAKQDMRRSDDRLTKLAATGADVTLAFRQLTSEYVDAAFDAAQFGHGLPAIDRSRPPREPKQDETGRWVLEFSFEPSARLVARQHADTHGRRGRIIRAFGSKVFQERAPTAQDLGLAALIVGEWPARIALEDLTIERIFAAMTDAMRKLYEREPDVLPLASPPS